MTFDEWWGSPMIQEALDQHPEEIKKILRALAKSAWDAAEVSLLTEISKLRMVRGKATTDREEP